jgi:hypothetical protein
MTAPWSVSFSLVMEDDKRKKMLGMWKTTDWQTKEVV